MAKTASQGPNRSAFIREMLKAAKNVSYKEVAAAWAKQGHKESLQQALFYNVKHTMKRKNSVPKESATPSTARAPAAPEVDHSMLDIEKALDKLVAQATSMGDWKLADALRVARRRVSAALV